MSTANELTRRALRSILNGQAPNGTSPECCGRWADKVQGAYEAHAAGGTDQARLYIDLATKEAPDLAKLLASDDPFERLGGFTARELQHEDLPEPEFIVDGVIPEGTSLLVSPPKLGKTMLAQNVAVAIATGGRALGKVPVRRGTVLFLALEGSKRGLQRRLRTMLGDEPWPDDLYFYREWEPSDAGGLELMRRFVSRHRGTRLIVVDTLKRVRGQGNARRNAYDEDYEALQPMAALGDELGVSFLIIHHTNKRDSGDVMDLVSGSTGLTAAVDNVLVMQKKRGETDARLVVIPREEEEQELALRFDPSIATWILRGRAEEVAKTDERQTILDAIKENGPMKPKDIAIVLDVEEVNIRRLTRKMLEAGTLFQEQKRGPYSLPPGNSGNSGNYGRDAKLPPDEER